MTTHPYWEILGQLMENHLLSLGSAWQWFPPCFHGASATLLMGSRGRERGRKVKGGERKEKVCSFTGLEISLLLVEPSWSSQLPSQWETPHESECLPNTTLKTFFFLICKSVYASFPRHGDNYTPHHTEVFWKQKRMCLRLPVNVRHYCLSYKGLRKIRKIIW